MKTGFQTKGISYWDHGALVAARFRDLMNPNPNMTWRLPNWFVDNADMIRRKLAPDFEYIITYQQWHDLSKPFCRVIDNEGRIHYPNHASLAGELWCAAGGSAKIGRLISHDMDMHLLKPSQVENYQHVDISVCLLTTALCEVHANAGMFGGMQSDSFKIKIKHLDRLGSAFFRAYGVQHLLSHRHEDADNLVKGLL